MKLADFNVVTTIAVTNLDQAKEFYDKTLGLTLADTIPAGISFTSGNTDLFVYQSDTAGSGKATCANWNVDDIMAVVDELKGRGVVFETYDIPGAQKEGDVMVMGNTKATWFKDPDGNILGITQMGQ